MLHVMHFKQTAMVMVLFFLTSMMTLPASAEERKGSGAKTTAPGTEQMKGSMKDGKEGKLVLGELTRIEGEFYFVKKSDGKEVKLHVAQSSQKSGPLKQGDQVEAQVDDKNHVLSIHGQGSTDRRDLKDPDVAP
jgi:hypothetical protein